MSENEKLDIGYHGSGRWQKLRDSIRAGKSILDVADEANVCLARTFKNLQKLFEEENKIPMKQVLAAATGEDGSFEEIMRQSRYGRDYLKLFESQARQGLDDRTIVENVLCLTVDRFLDQISLEIIGEDRFQDVQSFRKFRLSVEAEIIDGRQRLAKQIIERPDSPLKMPSRSAEQKERHQEELLGMSLRPDAPHEGRPR